jgi:hypothetical protein
MSAIAGRPEGYCGLTQPPIVVPAVVGTVELTGKACASCRTYAKRQERVSHRSLENTVRFPQAAQAVVVRILKKTDKTGERQQLTTREG